MIPESYIPYLILAFSTYLIGAGSPGPATLAIMGSSMRYGRKNGMALASGVTLGSFSWGLLAALGLSSLMTGFEEIFVFVKIIGGLFLLWLASKSLRSALKTDSKLDVAFENNERGAISFFLRGFALHMTNPKAVLVWGAIITLGLPPQATENTALWIVLTCSSMGTIIFFTYAVMFSSSPMVKLYERARRYIEGAMAAFFGFAGAKVLIDSIEEL